MELKLIVEAILFSSDKPLSPKEIRGILDAAANGSQEEGVQAFKKTNEEAIEASLKELEQDHAEAGRSYRLQCLAGAWQFVTQPDYAPWLRSLLGKRNRSARLSQPALETLAIIAYRQPLTRSEIEQIRGVSVDGVMQTLLERELIEPVGRAEVAGRPITYGTTAAFLDYFGLGSLEDLPEAEELMRIPVKPPDESASESESGVESEAAAESASTGESESADVGADSQSEAQADSEPGTESEPADSAGEPSSSGDDAEETGVLHEGAAEEEPAATEEGAMSDADDDAADTEATSSEIPPGETPPIDVEQADADTEPPLSEELPNEQPEDDQPADESPESKNHGSEI